MIKVHLNNGNLIIFKTDKIIFIKAFIKVYDKEIKKIMGVI